MIERGLIMQNQVVDFINPLDSRIYDNMSNEKFTVMVNAKIDCIELKLRNAELNDIKKNHIMKQFVSNMIFVLSERSNLSLVVQNIPVKDPQNVFKKLGELIYKYFKDYEIIFNTANNIECVLSTTFSPHKKMGILHIAAISENNEFLKLCISSMQIESPTRENEKLKNNRLVELAFSYKLFLSILKDLFQVDYRVQDGCSIFNELLIDELKIQQLINLLRNYEINLQEVYKSLVQGNNLDISSFKLMHNQYDNQFIEIFGDRDRNKIEIFLTNHRKPLELDYLLRDKPKLLSNLEGYGSRIGNIERLLCFFYSDLNKIKQGMQIESDLFRVFYNIMHNCYEKQYLSIYGESYENEVEFRYLFTGDGISLCDNPLSLKDKFYDIGTQDIDGRTPLHYSAIKNNYEAIKLLTTLNAGINVQDKDGRTSLHYCAMNDNFEAIKLIVTLNAGINVQDKDGRTPLHYCTMNDNFEAIKLIVTLNAGINVQDKDSRTPLHYCAMNDNFEAIKLIVTLNAGINVQDKDGRTPLHYCAINNNFDAADYLISCGANINLKDNCKKKPYDYNADYEARICGSYPIRIYDDSYELTEGSPKSDSDCELIQEGVSIPMEKPQNLIVTCSSQVLRVVVDSFPKSVKNETVSPISAREKL